MNTIQAMNGNLNADYELYSEWYSFYRINSENTMG